MIEIPKAYEPQAVEEKWYQFWVKQGCFTADPARVTDERPAYSIVIPPPNVTGMLHMGHVLNNTIQDILARKARMDGKEVLWLPGTDHAGIATQVQVEKALKKEERLTKYDLGREKFLERVWTWKEKHGGIIINQLKKLGCSCDWTRERFTMDAEYSRCVQKVFVELYKKGLIYRGKRMVNWCPASQTALSDEEVEMKPQKGFMYHFKVEVAETPGSAGGPPADSGGAPEDSSIHLKSVERVSGEPPDTARGPRALPGPDGKIWLTIATTRPETIPGDTAVAVNPKDPRYAHLIGQHIVRPLPAELPRAQKLIPIIADDHVDFEFGTGVLKVTPAHDKADFDIGARHKLPVVDIMNPDGTMNTLAGGPLAGLERFQARKVAVELLREQGVLIEEKPYENNVGFSQRADVPIEPRLSEQWFLKYPAVAQSKASVAEGQMKFYPDRWTKVYDHWLTNIQDWCISRQLWWGHRVPVWYRGGEVHCGLEAPQGDGWQQDPDVLDTWFSSWLWPFATMGWPEKTDTLRKFYPTTDLVTGPDIIFFWVARMIMAGYEFMDELPFKNVYFTGIIRDKQGRKMSKSLGNSPDPLDLIAKFGADALRFGVMRSAPLGSDILFDEKNVELGRNFCTKLWNAARFRQMQGGETEADIVPTLLTSDDKWILLRLDAAIAEVSSALTEYRFADAANALYRFFWSEYCDWYVEASKASLGSIPSTESTPSMDKVDDGRRANTLAVMDYVFSHTLRLFHPFMPFITEELWQGMGFAKDMPAKQGGETIMFAPWPKPFTAEEREYFILDESDEQFANAKYEVVNLGRGLRRDFNIASSKRVRFVLKPTATLADHETAVLQLLLNAEPLEVNAAFSPAKGTPVALTPLGELFLPLDGLIDVAAERERIGKEIAKADDELAKVRTKLADPNFAGKVPAKVLEDHQTRERDWAEKHAQLTKMREALGAS